MSSKKPTSRQKQALADPVTQAASDAALAEAKQRFDPEMQALFREAKALKGSRDAVAMMALKARFDRISLEQAKFAEARLADLLKRDGDGSALVDA